MKLSTHYVFSSGLISLALVFTRMISFPDIIIISFFISYVVNRIIDGLGHEMAVYNNKAYPKRIPRTHTVLRSVIWGIITVIPILLLILIFHIDEFFLPVIIAAIIVGPSHMLLDIFTQAGIYAKKDGKWKRVAFAHFAYNNAFVNGLASVSGLLMLFFAFIFH